MEVLSIENPQIIKFVESEVNKVKCGTSNEKSQNKNISDFIGELCIEEIGVDTASLEEETSLLRSELKSEKKILSQKQEGLNKVDMHETKTEVISDGRPFFLSEKFLLCLLTLIMFVVGCLNYRTIYDMLLVLDGKASISLALVCTLLVTLGLELLYYKGLVTERAKSQFRFICNIILIIALVTFLLTFCYQYLVPDDNSVFQGGLDDSTTSSDSGLSRYIKFILLLSRLSIEYIVQFYIISAIIDTISGAGTTKKKTVIQSDAYQSFSKILAQQKSEIESISLRLSKSQSKLEKFKSRKRQLVRDSILLANKMYYQTPNNSGE